MISSKYTTRRSDEGFGVYFVLSLFAHIILGIVVFSVRSPTLPIPSVMEVSIEPSTVLTPKEQIVSPPSQPAKEPPRETSKISDIDSQAVIEQVKRGDNGGPQVATEARAPAHAAQPAKHNFPKEPQLSDQRPAAQRPSEQKPTEQKKQSEPVKEAPKKQIPKPAEPRSPAASDISESKDQVLKSLTLDDSTLTQKFARNRSELSKQPASSQGTTTDLNQYRAFSRPQGSGAAFIGSAGVSDHLPSLPDGDITLLNAKANTYAGFVRRVAVQVFGQLKSKGWERLSAQELRALSDVTTVEAVLSPEGNLIRTVIISSSGSAAFDAVVNQSVAAGTRDPNPPPGARANDGQIHFIFKARSWSQVGVNARNGLPSERRWLLLATGLE
jgi:hypothetical protein